MKQTRSFWLACGAAMAGAALLLLISSSKTEWFGWGGGASLGSEPFAFNVTIDTDQGTIDSDLTGLPATAGDLSGLAFTLDGDTGAGAIWIKARDPSGVVVLESGTLPAQGVIVTDDPGRYEILVSAPGGSAGFDLWISAERTTGGVGLSQISPSRELGLGLVAAAFVALLLSFGHSAASRRAAALPLLIAAMSIAVTLAMNHDHHWYWNEGTHLIWLITLVLAASAAWHLAQPASPIVVARAPWRGVFRILQVNSSVVAVMGVGLTALTSAVYGGGFLGGHVPSSYSGDYMVMGVHVILFEATVPLTAVAAAMVRRSSSAPTPPRHSGTDSTFGGPGPDPEMVSQSARGAGGGR